MYLNRLKMCLKFKNCIKMLAFNPTFSFENYAKYLNFRLHSLSAFRLWDKNTLGWHFVLSPPQVCEMSVNVNVYANTLSQAHTKNGRTIKQINQVATCHSLVLSISKLITSFNEDKRFVCSCLSVLPVRRLSAAHYVHGSTFIYICICMYKNTPTCALFIFCVSLDFVFNFNCPVAVLFSHNERSLVK